MRPDTIAERMLVLILSSVYGTVYTFTNCVLDIYSDKTRDECVNGLRDEIDSVVSRYGDLNTSQAINRLYRVDSVLRESMRLSCFAIIGLQRIVACREGLEIGQVRAPFGSRLGIPIQAIHHDKDYYDSPLVFDAFRFSRPFEGVDQEKNSQKRELSVSVTKSFLTFGYGRHTCPGRWFAVRLMKQNLALLIQNYDIECIATPPPKKSLAHLVLPPTNSPVRIRRRL
jgi:cytochrome P450